MKTIWHRLRDEPAVAIATTVAVINVTLLLPDWRAALASAAVTLSAGAGIRVQVTPTRKLTRAGAPAALTRAQARARTQRP